MLNFEVAVVVAVLLIFSTFAYGAFLAEKAVNAKHKAELQTRAHATGAKGKK